MKVAASTITAARLSDYLQAALVLLAQQQFTITPALQSWGYAVVARPSRPEAGPSGETAASGA